LFSGGGSGTLMRLAVLRYEVDGASGRIVNLLPFVAITNVGEEAIWTLPGVSKYPVLADADFVWGDGESHFGDHFYNVEVWTFEPSTELYAKVLSYRTSKKYPGGDDAEVKVLVPEREEILRRLAPQ